MSCELILAAVVGAALAAAAYLAYRYGYKVFIPPAERD